MKDISKETEPYHVPGHACLPSEQFILGYLLINNSVFEEVSDILISEDFVCPAHQAIFTAMDHIYGEGGPIDVVTLTNTLKFMGQYEAMGGAAYLAQLLEITPSGLHWKCHARAIAKGHPKVEELIIRLPDWAVVEIDAYVARRGISRQAAISTWVVDRLEYLGGRYRPPREERRETPRVDR